MDKSDKKIEDKKIIASVVQLVEYFTFNEGVVGS